MDERSQTIIRSRWLTDKKETLQTLAKQFNISLERIRQLEKALLGSGVGERVWSNSGFDFRENMLSGGVKFSR